MPFQFLISACSVPQLPVASAYHYGMYSNINPYPNAGFSMFGYQPTPQPTFQSMGQGQSLVKVSGIEGAKAFQMPPNSAVALFHESEDILYVKTTDGAGFPTIRTFKFQPVDGEDKPTQFVTLDEFNRFKEEISGKLSVRKEYPTTTVEG